LFLCRLGTPGLKANVLPAVEPLFKHFVEEIEQQEGENGKYT
jgi:hypothetical protein